MTARKRLWREGKSFSKQSELVISKLGAKPRREYQKNFRAVQEASLHARPSQAQRY